MLKLKLQEVILRSIPCAILCNHVNRVAYDLHESDADEIRAMNHIDWHVRSSYSSSNCSYSISTTRKASWCVYHVETIKKQSEYGDSTHANNAKHSTNTKQNDSSPVRLLCFLKWS
jgi:hypothetical protein